MPAQKTAFSSHLFSKIPPLQLVPKPAENPAPQGLLTPATFPQSHSSQWGCFLPARQCQRSYYPVDCLHTPASLIPGSRIHSKHLWAMQSRIRVCMFPPNAHIPTTHATLQPECQSCTSLPKRSTFPPHMPECQSCTSSKNTHSHIKNRYTCAYTLDFGKYPWDPCSIYSGPFSSSSSSFL